MSKESIEMSYAMLKVTLTEVQKIAKMTKTQDQFNSILEKYRIKEG
jgi:hypothetical protein